MALHLCCDLGGTYVKSAIYRDGVQVAFDQSTVTADSIDGLFSAVRTVAQDLCRRAQVSLTALDALGLSFPSIIAPGESRISSTQKYAYAQGVDLEPIIHDAFGLPAHLENDARAALLGEWQAGCAQGCDNVVLLTLGTGIGTAALIEGRVLRGVHGHAGILGGHFIVNLGGRRGATLATGCAEAEAGSTAIREWIESAPELASSQLRDAEPDFRAVFACRHSDALAASIYEHLVASYAATVCNLIHAYDPEMIVCTGGCFAAGQDLLDDITARVRANTWSAWGRAEFVVASDVRSSVLAGMDALCANPALGS